MANYKCIPIHIDAASGKQINEQGSIIRDNEYIRLLFDETVILCCQFHDISWSDGSAELTPHAINPSLTVAAFGDCDFDPQTPFMFLSEQSNDENNKVNLEGDWLNSGNADPSLGQISFRISTNTTRFKEALETGSSFKNFYFCITGVPAGQTEKTVLAYFRFKAENRPTSSTGAPSSTNPEYLKSQEVQALVKSAPVLQYSVDGSTNWHDTQADTDRYRREQRNGGEWSAATQLLLGAQGIQGVQGEKGDNGTDVAPKGTYNAATTYILNEGVTYNGSYYRSLANDNTGNQPDTSSEKWELMISKGETGSVNAASGLTLQEASAPATPASGVVLYSDSGDSGKAKLKDKNGNVKNIIPETQAYTALANSGAIVINNLNADKFSIDTPASGTTLDINTATFPNEGDDIKVKIKNPGSNISVAAAIKFPNEDNEALSNLPSDKTVILIFTLENTKVYGFKLCEVANV